MMIVPFRRLLGSKLMMYLKKSNQIFAKSAEAVWRSKLAIAG